MHEKVRAFLREKVFVNSSTMNYFDHRRIFFKHQPWAEASKLHISEFRQLLIGLQKATPLKIETNSDVEVTYLGNHSYVTRNTAYGTNENDARRFAGIDISTIKTVVEYINDLAGIPQRIVPRVKCTAHLPGQAVAIDTPTVTSHRIPSHQVDPLDIVTDSYLSSLQKFVAKELLCTSSTMYIFEMPTGSGKTTMIIKFVQMVNKTNCHLIHVLFELSRASSWNSCW